VDVLTPEIWVNIGRYLGAGLALGFGGIGAAIGMGMAAGAANEGGMRQPAAQSHLMRTMLIGQAVGGSPSIFALVVGLLIFYMPVSPDEMGLPKAAALAGAGLAIGIGCLGSGVGCGWPAAAACAGVARNPRRSTGVMSLMIIGQAMAQSPAIFATVISLILLFRPLNLVGLAGVGVAIGAGIAMGAGALGPGIGSGTTAGGALRGVSNWPKSQGLALRTMLIGQAVSQTPAIFGLLVAFIMMFALADLEPTLLNLAKTIGAGIAVGIGGIGPGIGSGLAGETACVASAAKPRLDPIILRTMLIGQAVSQSTAIYALIIALILIYLV
jgi:F-type H+-transporting ATPase subunit c